MVFRGLQAVWVCAHDVGSTLASNAIVGSVKDFIVVVYDEFAQVSKFEGVCLRVGQTRSRSSKRNDVLVKEWTLVRRKGKRGKMCPRERQGSVLKFDGEGEALIEY